jgi:hypothetical protein
MTVMLKGKTPKFKVVPVDPSDNATGTGPDLLGLKILFFG